MDVVEAFVVADGDIDAQYHDDDDELVVSRAKVR